MNNTKFGLEINKVVKVVKYGVIVL